MCNTVIHPQRATGLLLCFIFFVVGFNELSAQHFTYYNQIKQVNESGSTPEKASMVYSIETPVNPLTGAACFDIPIYSIQLNDYALPITLHYETSGFKVAAIASNVGMGWNLNAGGRITRTIKGFRDEQPYVGYCAQDNNADSIHEYIVGLTHVDCLDTLLTPWDTSLFASLLNVTDNLFDAEPDIYSFNFAGYSGNFIYDMDNNIQLIPEQNFDIQKTNNGFVITVDNGDKYYFGEGDASKETVNLYYNTPLFWDIVDFERIHGNEFKNFKMRYLFNNSNYEYGECNAWFLTKIEVANSNQQILFEYELDNVTAYLGTDETYLYGRHSLEYSDPTLTNGYDWVLHRINRYKKSYIPRLKKISWQNGTIVFVPSYEERKDLISGGRSINKIIISSMNDSFGNLQQYDIDLDLNYFTDFQNFDPPLKNRNGYPLQYRSYFRRLRLDKITFNDLEASSSYEYSFSYNRMNNQHCFSTNTSQVDYWGYFKPRSTDWFDSFIERYAIKPKLYYYENGKDNPLYNSAYSVWARSGDEEPYVFEGNSDMTPDLAGSKEFTIKSVTLPTGGIIYFNYELNDFFFDNQVITGPGVRVKSLNYRYLGINNFDKTYSYNNNGISSGRITNIPNIGQQNMDPQYQGLTAGLSGSEKTNRLTARQFSTVTDMYSTSESSVQYEKVTEHCYNNNSNLGKTVFHYQLNMMVEDSVLMVGATPFVKKTKCKWTKIYHHPNHPSLNPPFHNIQHIDASPMFTYPITSWYNAFLTKKEYFDDNERLLESTEYKYSLKPSNDSVFYIQSKYLDKYAISWVIYDEHQNPQQELPVYQYDILWGVNYYKTGVRQLDTIIHKHYSEGNDNLANVATRTFNYTANNYVGEERTENSDGSVIKQTYNYPLEYATFYPNSVYADMLDRNMLNSVVEQYTSVDNKVTQGACCRFETTGSNNEFIKPEKLFKLRTNSPLSNFQPLGQDSHYELTDEMKYDPSSGNLVEIWDESDGRTTYVWGFHNSLLLAKIQNATDSEVRNALSCTMEALQEKTDTNELIGIFQNLRTSLSSACVTSYAYDLFQNLVSITDPSGKTNRFEYDDALRLKLTRDVENNILQKYEYHYHQ